MVCKAVARRMQRGRQWHPIGGGRFHDDQGLGDGHAGGRKRLLKGGKAGGGLLLAHRAHRA